MRILGAIVEPTTGILAIGVADLFKDSYPPITGMIGGGPFGLQPGEWTDDTSMALCLAESLVANEGTISPKDLAERFVRWWQTGENSVTGRSRHEEIWPTAERRHRRALLLSRGDEGHADLSPAGSDVDFGDADRIGFACPYHRLYEVLRGISERRRRGGRSAFVVEPVEPGFSRRAVVGAVRLDGVGGELHFLADPLVPRSVDVLLQRRDLLKERQRFRQS